jgi:hypothetical protein
MNLKDNPTIEDLKQLVANQEDDRYDHILYVTKNGDVHFSKLGPGLVPADWANKNKDNYQFRLESFHRGNGYVGPEAAKDDDWVFRLMNALVLNWQKKNVGYIDDF